MRRTECEGRVGDGRRDDAPAALAGVDMNLQRSKLRWLERTLDHRNQYVIVGTGHGSP